MIINKLIYYYTYKITCLKGSFKGHYYFGQHKTKNVNDPNDGYAGGGVLLKSYYKKYGAIEGETYEKEIIKFYNNKQELNQAEYELIGDRYKNDPMCMNLKSGGDQNIEYSDETLEKLSKWKRTEETKQKIREKAKGRDPWNKGLKGYRKGIKKANDTIQKMKQPHPWFNGKHWVIDENTGKRKWIL